jgi:hypothetical protein
VPVTVAVWPSFTVTRTASAETAGVRLEEELVVDEARTHFDFGPLLGFLAVPVSALIR